MGGYFSRDGPAETAPENRVGGSFRIAMRQRRASTRARCSRFLRASTSLRYLRFNRASRVAKLRPRRAKPPGHCFDTFSFGCGVIGFQQPGVPVGRERLPSAALGTTKHAAEKRTRFLLAKMADGRLERRRNAGLDFDGTLRTRGVAFARGFHQRHMMQAKDIRPWLHGWVPRARRHFQGAGSSGPISTNIGKPTMVGFGAPTTGMRNCSTSAEDFPNT